MRFVLSAIVLLAGLVSPLHAAALSTPVTLSLEGKQAVDATLGFGEILRLRIVLAPNASAWVEAVSPHLGLAFDVRDGEPYTSDAPGAAAAHEYVTLTSSNAARTVEIDVRPSLNEGGRGNVSVVLFGASDPRATIATSLASAGRGYRDNSAPEDLRARLGNVTAAHAVCEQRDDTACIADTAMAMGELQVALAERDAAQANFEAAVAMYVKIGNALGEIEARDAAAASLYYAGKMSEAEAVYARCGEIAREHGLVYRQAKYENNVAVMRHYSGDLDQALVHYARARELFGNVPIDAVGMLRSNIGGVYELRGDAKRARAAYQDAIDFAGTNPGLASSRAAATSNLGGLLADIGEKQAAIVLITQSIELFHQLGQDNDEARMLSILSYQYSLLGRYALAKELSERALPLCKTNANIRCEAQAQRGLGHVARAQGHEADAEQSYRRAIELYTQSKTRHDLFLTGRFLAELLIDSGRPAEALALADGMIATQDGDAKLLQSDMMDVQRGRALAALGRSDEARAIFLPLEGEGGRHTWSSATVAPRAKLELARLDAAARHWDAVAVRLNPELDRIARVRQEFFDPRARAEFLAAQQETFELLIRASIARARAGDAAALADAFALEERSRSRALLDALASADTRAAGTNDAVLAARDALRMKSVALDRLRNRGTAKDADRIAALASDVALARVALELVESTAHAERPERRIGVPRDLAATQRMLKPRDAMLVFHVRKTAAWVWVVTRDGARVLDLPDHATIAQRVQRFVDDVRGEGADTAQDARWLHATLIEAAGLPADVERLTVVPDGPLHALPFAALRAVDGRYLVESVQIAQLPSASVGLALTERQPAAAKAGARDIVVFADPVFTRDDARMRRETATDDIGPTQTMAFGGDDLLGAQLLRSGDGDTDALQRLPGTAREADAIRAAFGTDRVQVFEGFDATLDAARGAAATSARILHFATHGLVNPAAPELTGLALSRWRADGTPAPSDGFLSLASIGDTRFSADLVVLSACDSALGQQIESEGLMGIARAFLASGAGSVVATLWPVSDRDTAKLEARFAAELQAGTAAPLALAIAQREALADPSRRRPRSWAAFGFFGPAG